MKSYHLYKENIIRYFYSQKTQKKFDFDFFVIGGGSGGLSASKAAASYGKQVAIADFVLPTPSGTKWGIGGTCVNVGCIPKKMMHHSGNMFELLGEMEYFGYEGKIEKKHNWGNMVNRIQTYIKKLNFSYKMSLMKEKVKYFNEYATLVDRNTVELTDLKGNKRRVTAEKILVAVGGRPKYPEIPGAKEFCITSDDLFSLKKTPGKTLVVGASYIALVKFNMKLKYKLFI